MKQAAVRFAVPATKEAGGGVSAPRPTPRLDRPLCGSGFHRASAETRERSYEGPSGLRVWVAASVLLKACGTDAVRDEVSSSRYEGVQRHIELIPHAFDGTLVAPGAHRH